MPLQSQFFAVSTAAEVEPTQMSFAPIPVTKQVSLVLSFQRKNRDGERPQGIMHSCGTSPPKPESPATLNKEETQNADH